MTLAGINILKNEALFNEEQLGWLDAIHELCYTRVLETVSG